MLNLNVGKQLRYLRLEQKCSQRLLAKKTGVSRPHIINIEQERRTPSLSVLAKLAQALDAECRIIISAMSKDN